MLCVLCVRLVGVVQCGPYCLLKSLDSWSQGALCSTTRLTLMLSSVLHPRLSQCALVCMVLGVPLVIHVGWQVLGTFPQGALRPVDALLTLILSLVFHPRLSQCALVCMVLGVSLGSTVVCDGCPGPWILVRKVHCAQEMLFARVSSMMWHKV